MLHVHCFKVHREAENLNKAGYHIILIGHQNHPEVIGTMGQLPEGTIDLIQNEDEAKNYKIKEIKKLHLLLKQLYL